jgi:amidohydrolase
VLSDPLIKRLKEEVGRSLPKTLELYRHLHARAELSGQEEKTAARVAEELKSLSIPVTTGVGGHGVVGLLENGPGPRVMLRADMDALPIREETGLDYASDRTCQGPGGQETPIMHACGHDVHTSVLVGTAGLLTRLKDFWRGSVVLIGQPAEEALGGARAMVQDGLWSRFPRPDAGLGLHVNPEYPTGSVRVVSGYVTTGAGSVDLIVRGVGGHGAYPHQTKDPVVLAAQIILGLQTLISRSVDPRETAVITVGSIHGGTKRNIVGEEVVLSLTIRTYNPQVMKDILAGIERMAENTARAAGFPEDRLPVLRQAEDSLPPVYNDPELAERMEGLFKGLLGRENVEPIEPQIGSEDFGQLGQADPPFPVYFFMLGATDQTRLDEARRDGGEVPLLHTSRFYPDPEGTLATGLTTMAGAALEILDKKD